MGPPLLSGGVGSVFNAETLAPFKKLKAIATRSTGIDHIDLAYCRKNKIKILSVPHYGAATVAEFTFTLLLSLIRKLADGREMLAELRVQQSALSGMDLAGKTIGLIGLGDIGGRVAQIAQAFGMKVLAYDPYIKKKAGVKFVTLDMLLSVSDIISLHCPATCDNQFLLNAEAFKKMKTGVLLINTARGQLIDTEALYEAVLTKKVLGAALDVAMEEFFLFSSPFVKDVRSLSKEELEVAFLNQKLLQMEEVIMTPHMAFNTQEAIYRILQTTLQNIKKLP
ncbi:MAG: hydroxyacid dehydrogenase [Alphaproteobacteria bacterium]|nr:hydroxyacid dehydrogenase [Alphaproteobacteria bacterium]MBN2780080.1 hydroxyacid dehydrogenase [Alphaproteobacteria bacterium]